MLRTGSLRTYKGSSTKTSTQRDLNPFIWGGFSDAKMLPSWAQRGSIDDPISEVDFTLDSSTTGGADSTPVLVYQSPVHAVALIFRWNASLGWQFDTCSPNASTIDEDVDTIGLLAGPLYAANAGGERVQGFVQRGVSRRVPNIHELTQSNLFDNVPKSMKVKSAWPRDGMIACPLPMGLGDTGDPMPYLVSRTLDDIQNPRYPTTKSTYSLIHTANDYEGDYYDLRVSSTEHCLLQSWPVSVTGPKKSSSLLTPVCMKDAHLKLDIVGDLGVIVDGNSIGTWLEVHVSDYTDTTNGEKIFSLPISAQFFHATNYGNGRYMNLHINCRLRDILRPLLSASTAKFINSPIIGWRVVTYASAASASIVWGATSTDQSPCQLSMVFQPIAEQDATSNVSLMMFETGAEYAQNVTLQCNRELLLMQNATEMAKDSASRNYRTALQTALMHETAEQALDVAAVQSDGIPASMHDLPYEGFSFKLPSMGKLLKPLARAGKSAFGVAKNIAKPAAQAALTAAMLGNSRPLGQKPKRRRRKRKGKNAFQGATAPEVPPEPIVKPVWESKSKPHASQLRLYRFDRPDGIYELRSPVRTPEGICEHFSVLDGEADVYLAGAQPPWRGSSQPPADLTDLLPHNEPPVKKHKLNSNLPKPLSPPLLRNPQHARHSMAVAAAPGEKVNGIVVQWAVETKAATDVLVKIGGVDCYIGERWLKGDNYYEVAPDAVTLSCADTVNATMNKLKIKNRWPKHTVFVLEGEQPLTGRSFTAALFKLVAFPERSGNLVLTGGWTVVDSPDPSHPFNWKIVPDELAGLRKKMLATALYQSRFQTDLSLILLVSPDQILEASNLRAEAKTFGLSLQYASTFFGLLKGIRAAAL